jgi:NitT/TauT family transport system permease protein
MRRRGRLLKKAAIAVFWLALWQLLAALVNNKVLIVGPYETLLALIDMLPTAAFWRAVLNSLLRITAGFCIGGLLGVLLAFCACFSPLLREVFSPFVSAMKAVPVASFVILVLIWAGSAMLSLFVTTVVVLPILYINTLEGLLATDRKLLELAAVYHMPFPARLRGIYLPQLRPHLVGAAQLACGMAWKSGVAAEVIGQPLTSLGNELYRAKIYLETDRILAVTAVTVFLSWLLERLLGLALRGGKRREEGKK